MYCIRMHGALHVVQFQVTVNAKSLALVDISSMLLLLHPPASHLRLLDLPLLPGFVTVACKCREVWVLLLQWT